MRGKQLASSNPIGYNEGVTLDNSRAERAAKPTVREIPIPPSNITLIFRQESDPN